MTFNQFQRLNAERCEAKFHKIGDEEWPIQNWAIAIAGESGELCNLIKKIIRGDFSLQSQRKEVLKELADIITYCDLAMTHLGANTEDELMDKFDEVSFRVGFIR